LFLSWDYKSIIFEGKKIYELKSCFSYLKIRIKSLNNSSNKTDSFDTKKLLNHKLIVILNLIVLKAYVNWNKETDFDNVLADTNNYTQTTIIWATVPIASSSVPPPMCPIMPPNIPVNPSYQTIWMPIHVPRDPYSIEQMWKKSRTPTFIERGRLKNRPSIREGTPESWWRRPQPNFCTEPIFVNDRTPVKRWAFNQADERCYRYVDYCFDDKHNSFNTLQQCLTSCWRATV
jgi:hypothetical protein